MTALTGATLGADFAAQYSAFDLGTLPGVPSGAGQSMGGVYVKPEEPDALYAIGESESPNAALYRVKLRRDACKHIVGFSGTAERLANIPFADASLVAAPNGWLFSMFPWAQLGHLTLGSPVVASDLIPLGVPGPHAYNPNDQFPGDSPGGMAVVPAGLAASGELVAVAYPSGDFYHLTLATNGGETTAVGAQKRSTIPNGPGAFAYVPKGSPGFAAPSIVVTEWYQDTTWKSAYNNPPDGTPQAVAAYEVDEQGDPKPATRRPFFSRFPRPWGAFFEPVTGDFLFATWRGTFGQLPDRVVVVRGFTVPAPPPPPK
jgi:hypothetical protein